MGGQLVHFVAFLLVALLQFENVGPDFMPGGKPFGRILADQAVDKGGDVHRDVGKEGVQRRGPGIEMAAHDLLGIRTREGRMPGQHVVKRGAERIHVGADVAGSVAPDQLRGGIQRRQHDRAAGPFGVRYHGQPEIHQLGAAAIVDHDVVRLDVAMDQLGFIPTVGEHLGEIARDSQGVIDVQPAILVDPGEQGPAGNVFHGEVIKAIDPPRIIGLDNPGMKQRGGGAGLVQEPFNEVRVARVFIIEDLEGDPARQVGLFRQIDHPHSTPPKQSLNAIAGDHLSRL